ncbi:U6 snRNA-associated Sm-like protein LSm7 isoform X2 [Cynocephalus volans]|uniref:U6 snRNA-associated Sm-like protein LSm7 isoform X2 n=1 Tax=Cynocephalus volans TaxID=110931 RepID=UPI002FCA5527
MADKEKKKKESILDLSKYIDKTIRVKFQGGREASGILKGFDPLLNLVLDGTIEYMRGPFQPQAATGRPRFNPKHPLEDPGKAM